MQEQIDRTDVMSVIDCCIISLNDFRSYVQLSVSQIDIVLSAATDYKFDRHAVGQTRDRVIFYPTTALDASLSRWNSKQVQFAFSAFARVRVDKRHYFVKISLLFLLMSLLTRFRLLPLPD